MRPPFVPRPTQVAASALTIAAAAAVAVPSAYLLVISAAGLLPRRRRSDGVEPETRFTILVPAHNEAAGIGRTLEAFNALDYPSDLFSVHVVADNCSDDTAEVVRRSRWTVHERRAPDDPGKGPALNWLLDELVAGGEAFDAILIVDADSTLAPGFLRAMNQVAREGYKPRRATTRCATPTSRPPRASGSPPSPAATTSVRSAERASADQRACTATA